MSQCTCGRELFAVATTGEAQLVTAGVIDKAAEAAFTEGQCHAFAMAVSEATGWPIVALVRPNDWAITRDVVDRIDGDTQRMSRAGLNEFADHFLVRRPDGMLVDIHGAHAPEDVFSHYGVETAYPHPVWGLMPAGDLTDDELEDLRDEWDGRLVAADPADLDWLYDRPTALAAARTLVAPLLASLA